MRQIVGFWRVGAAAAIVGCLAIAWAEEPQQSPPPDAKKAKKASPLEQLMATQSPQKPQPKKVAKKPPLPYGLQASTQSYKNAVAERKTVATIPFTSKEGKKGWKAVIPGGETLATPAVVDGKVFIGGGFNSTDFYALDAETGKPRWRYRTADHGPTAPVVDSGYVSFSTESCELEVLTAGGEPVWKKWLGVPLMSAPAIADGRVITAFPDSRGSRQYQYYLASFELRTGKELWRKEIADEVIAAPVIDDNRVFVATVDGTLHCFHAEDGAVAWVEKEQNATSAPTVWKDRCWFGRRQEETTTKAGRNVVQQTEQVAARGLDAEGAVRDLTVTSRLADYLGSGKRSVMMARQGKSSKKYASQRVNAGMGFPSEGIRMAGGDSDVLPSLPPGYSSAITTASVKNTAATNLGQAGALGVWSYQGSRPLFYEGRLYAAMGDSLSCVDVKTEKVLWKKDFRSAKRERETSDKATPREKEERLQYATVTPPVLVNHKVFVGTSYGEVVCLSAATGDVLWKATIGKPVVSQPVVADGRIYVSTKAGILYCLNTGDPRDDGWLMWGANATHTGRVDEQESEQASHRDAPLVARAVFRD